MKVLTVTVNEARRLFDLYAADRHVPTSLDTPPGFDPQLSAVDFSFKVECPSDFDCERNDSLSARTVASSRKSIISRKITRVFAG